MNGTGWAQALPGGCQGIMAWHRWHLWPPGDLETEPAARAGWQWGGRGGRGTVGRQWESREALTGAGSKRGPCFTCVSADVQDPSHCPATLAPCSERYLCFLTSCSTVEKVQSQFHKTETETVFFSSLNYINYMMSLLAILHRNLNGLGNWGHDKVTAGKISRKIQCLLL